MSVPIRTIVAGVSHPAENDPTLVAAAELARWTGARLHLVHAFNLPAVFGPAEVAYMSGAWMQQYADDQGALLKAAALRTPGAANAVCHSVPGGAPATAILRTAAEAGADLLVVGAAHAGRLATAFLGTTAQRVLRGAAAPVLVVRTPVRRPLERVLLTTDLSEPSAAVHEEGLDTVASLFGEPGAVRSLLVLLFPILPSPLPRNALDLTAGGQLGAFLRARRPRPGTVELMVRAGDPADEIAAEAEDWKADLLVVGTHARGWAARLALGSVAEAALRDAPCNVLAVPPRAAALEGAGEGGADLEGSASPPAPAAREPA